MKYAIAIILLIIAGLGALYYYHQHSILIYPNPNFAGVYECKGYDPYLDKYYAGKISITPQDTVYSVKMEYDTGEIYRATAGLFDTNTLAVVFQDIHQLDKIGLERYSYSKDHKEIQGYWVYLGGSKLGKEVCEKIN